MTQGINGYGSTSTDELLRRAMEDAGDHDPSRIRTETGKDLHFDATRSADGHREGLRSDGAALGNAKSAAVDQARDTAIEKAGELAAHYAPALGGLGTITGAVVGLGALYKSALEDSRREGEGQRALGASDAGVVALAQTLDVEPGFRSFVAQAHAGAGNAAAAMVTKLNDSEHAGVRAALQLRADQGLVDAAGYAKNAAAATRPMIDETQAKLTAAKAATDPATAAKLTSQAHALTAKAAETQRAVLAPVMAKAQGDAAYGLGVQRAVYLAGAATPAGSAHFDAVVSKAAANVHPPSASSVRVQG
jgi:hypothetical protein